MESKLEDSKPFREALQAILNKSPSLASLFGGTGPLLDPFRSRTITSDNNFLGKQNPSYFRFKDIDYGRELKRTTAVNMMRSRIAFETDVINDYFTRGQYPGKYQLRFREQNLRNGTVPDHNLNLDRGVATLNLALPQDVEVGDSFAYELIVHDDTLVEPFVNPFVVSVGPPQKPSNGRRRNRTLRGNQNNGDSENPQGLAIPTPIPVYEQDWSKHSFDKYSALKVIHNPSDEDEDPGSYDYYINMDNIYLNTELKSTRENPEIVKSRWQFGMVLIGMALLRTQEETELRDAENGNETLGDRVLSMTSAIAPVMLPLIEHLGGLTEEDLNSD